MGRSFAQNQYFYDAAEGVLTAVILLLAEYLPPREIDGVLRERRHIVSVFKLVQELLAPSILPDKNEFQLLMDRLPEEHKAKWFSGSALTAAEQSMASVMSTVLSRLNTFLDSELEQVLCFRQHHRRRELCRKEILHLPDTFRRKIRPKTSWLG